MLRAFSATALFGLASIVWWLMLANVSKLELNSVVWLICCLRAPGGEVLRAISRCHLHRDCQQQTSAPNKDGMVMDFFKEGDKLQHHPR